MSRYFDLGDISAGKYFMATSSCLGLLLAWISRDGSNAYLLSLLVAWQANVLVSIALVISVHVLLLKYTPISQLNPWLQLVLSGVAGSTLFSPLALLIDVLLMNEPMPANLVSEWMDEYSGVAPSVTLAWVAMNVPWLLGYRFEKQTEPSARLIESKFAQPQAHEEDDQNNRLPVNKLETLYDLLPAEIGQDIIYLKAELHYIKVATCQGEALVLFNLKDAASLFSLADGYLCHRSYWVSRSHIACFKKVSRGGELTLSNHAKIPVSKRKLSGFTAWLDLNQAGTIASV